MYSVLVADDNIHWQKNLCLKISQEEMFGAVWGSNDGTDAMQKIETLRPDIIILDIVMPNYDGITIIEQIQNDIPGYHPIIYILSGMGTNTIVHMLNTLDVSFYSLKPIALDTVITNLKRLVSEQEEEPVYPAVRQKTMAEMVEDTLRELGLPPHLQSSRCMKDALITYLNTPVDMRMLTKAIYPELAKRTGSTPGAVEKNIREAVSHIVENQSILYKKIFSFYNKKKITSSIFFSVLAEYIGKQYLVKT